MTMFEQFPVETLTHILKFLSICSRVKLASCNHTLQQQIYRECAGAWISIEFDFLENVRLGDLDLSRLLTRINARQVTKVLNLQCCDNVRGSGLAPLRSSRVLETISLPNHHFDPATVFWTLQTCIPYNLTHVMMNEIGEEFKDDVTIDFMRKLGEEKSARALENGVLCSDCCEPLVEQSMQRVPGLRGLPASICMECDKSYCRRASCPVGMLECTDCHQTFCSGCNTVLTCSDCGLTNCKDCNEDYDSCYKCRKVSCDGCGKVSLCSYCQEEQVCRDCGFASDLCDNVMCVFCDDCWQNKKCTGCEGHICTFCSSPRECGGCFAEYCEHCYLQQLSGCGVCHDNVGICIECMDGKLEHCPGCNIYVCTTHNRLVDCKSCGFRHCRACSFVKRCEYCLMACFEDCDCTAGQGLSKRAKIS